MAYKKKINFNFRIINIIRRLFVKLIVKIQNLTKNNKVDSVFDKRSNLEIFKHHLNFYKSYLPERSNINQEKLIEDASIYSINKEMDNSLFLVDIKKFTGYEGSYYFDEDSPLTNTAIQLIQKRRLKIEDSYLYKFFLEFQPKTYGELYELSNKNKLFNLSSNTIFMPWIHDSPLSIFHAGVFGPKHKSGVKHRLIRLRNIIENIELYGYLPTLEDSIEGYIAILNNDYRFVITAGHHRVAVLKALNKQNPEKYNFISVKYDLKRLNFNVVNNKEICEWPGIKSGFIDIDDSLEFYRKYFN